MKLEAADNDDQNVKMDSGTPETTMMKTRRRVLLGRQNRMQIADDPLTSDIQRISIPFTGTPNH